MGFRDLLEDLDETVFDVLGDPALIDGREVLGMLSAPWLQPKLGRINTGLREPHLVIRVADALGVNTGQQVVIDLPEQDGGGTYIIVRPEPGGDGLVTLVLRKSP
ncbi:Phage_base_V domain-containing protein [Pseudomonas donghuensis]|uniref:head-tail joining protein n=1 Tax=Pseudomonas donghuensis TaxID=1163398 RepID=UPI0039E09C38